MTTLRQQLLEELVLRGCAERTQEAYVQQLYQLAKFFHQSPAQLTNEQVRTYLLHLAQERYTLLSPRLLTELRSYWRLFRPRHWLFPATRTPDQPLVDATGHPSDAGSAWLKPNNKRCGTWRGAMRQWFDPLRAVGMN